MMSLPSGGRISSAATLSLASVAAMAWGADAVHENASVPALEEFMRHRCDFHSPPPPTPRDVTEYRTQATSAPLSALQQGACPKEALDATKRLYLHCAAGIRVHPAKACLEALGCDDVVALQEGISELYELGFDDLAE